MTPRTNVPVINVLMDLPENQEYSVATVAALQHSLERMDLEAEVRVARTDTLPERVLEHPGNGVVIGPGLPFARPDVAEGLIRSAREKGIPLVGT